MVPLTIPWIRSIGVADERLLEHAHHRDDARHGRLEAQPHAVLARGREQLLPVLGEQLLVRRDHVAARAPSRASTYSRAGSIPPISSTTMLRAGEDLREVCRACASAPR